MMAWTVRHRNKWLLADKKRGARPAERIRWRRASFLFFDHVPAERLFVPGIPPFKSLVLHPIRVGRLGDFANDGRDLVRRLQFRFKRRRRVLGQRMDQPVGLFPSEKPSRICDRSWYIWRRTALAAWTALACMAFQSGRPSVPGRTHRLASLAPSRCSSISMCHAGGSGIGTTGRD